MNWRVGGGWWVVRRKGVVFEVFCIGFEFVIKVFGFRFDFDGSYE